MSSITASFAAALAATSGSSSRLMRTAREMWLARLLAEDDDSDSAGDDGGEHHHAVARLPRSPPTLPAALVTSAPASSPSAAAASVVVDLTAAEDSSSGDGGGASNSTAGAAGASRFWGIIVDDDDSGADSDADSDVDSDVILTETTLPTPSESAESAVVGSRAGRKRARSEMTRGEPDLVVVERQVVEKAQATECTICCDPCTLSGPHRLVALKCGHLFGKQCIDRWMLTRKACPMCNLAVRKPDIRPLFSDHVAVVDNSGVAAMTEKFEAEQAKRIRLEAEVAQHKAEIARMSKQHLVELRRLREALASAQGQVAASSTAGAAESPSAAAAGAGAKPRWK